MTAPQDEAQKGPAGDQRLDVVVVGGSQAGLGHGLAQGFLERFGVDFGGLDYDFFLLFDRGATLGAASTPAGQLGRHRDR
jgi:hypothetical protein